MLNEKQVKAIELLVTGEYQVQQIADAVGVTRQTIHKWRTKDKEFIEEYGKRLQETTNAVSQKFRERLDTAVESLYDIITNPDIATRERKDACIYWINRVMGTPTNKVETIEDKDKEGIHTDVLEGVLAKDADDPKEDNNIIHFKSATN